VIDLLAGSLATVMALLVIRYSIHYVQQAYAINEVSSDPGGLTHRWVLKALIPLGFALFALQALAQTAAAARRLARPTAR
jgi:TRAP-type mannitol/chloroaromatic compound transport system permease small subunit